MSLRLTHTHTHYIDLSRKLNLEGLKEARKISPRDSKDYNAVAVASAMNIRGEYIRPYAASHGDLHQ